MRIMCKSWVYWQGDIVGCVNTCQEYTKSLFSHMLGESVWMSGTIRVVIKELTQTGNLSEFHNSRNPKN